MSTEIQERQEQHRINQWTGQQPFIDTILKKGLEYYAFREEDEYIRDLFRKDVKVVWTCIDGRHKKRSISTPGTCVLWDEEEIETVLDKVRRSGIKVRKVYRHRDCGAEALAMQQLMTSMSELEAQKAVGEKIERFAKALGAEVDMFKAMGHTRYHPERGLFLVGTEMFDMAPMGGIYPFQLNAQFTPSLEKMVEHVGLARKIAFGDSGPGVENFRKTPFIAGVFGDLTTEGYDYKSLAERLEPLVSESDGLMVVRGFDVDPEFLPA